MEQHVKVFESIVDTIGNTPLIKLNTISTNDVTFFAKMESFNPGRSSKDRIAVPMIDDAEKKGLLKPGGTIIEATSGNTGLALALVGIRRGYNVILIMPDKMSPEKINLVKAIGCEVIVCPTEVEPDDPRSYYSVAEKLAKETPNSFWARQYWNEANPKAHYNTTGPEIWRDTDGMVTHYVAGVGTGGTISGAAKYLKEKNPEIKVIAPDPEGSILAHYHRHRNTETEAKGYKVEGVGEDIIPTNVNFDVIDEFITINDHEAFEWTRKLAMEEGLFVGGSSGLAVAGAVKYGNYPKGSIVVIILPDTGERYLGKVFNDAWMRANGFLPPATTFAEVVNAKQPTLLSPKTVNPDATYQEVLEKFRKFESITQILVKSDDEYIPLHRREVYNSLLKGSIKISETIKPSDIPIEKLDINTPLDVVKQVVAEKTMVLVTKNDEVVTLITMKDLVENLEIY